MYSALWRGSTQFALDAANTVRDERGVWRVENTAGRHDRVSDIGGHMPFIGDGSLGVDVDGVTRFGFPTPSRKLELYSETMRDWGWPEHALPGWIPSHVHWEDLDLARGERILLPTFRLPTLIHTRGSNSKLLAEISHGHPMWIHPSDAEQLGIGVGGLVRISTAIGHFVIRAWRTEGIRPGVVGVSHHMGRWRVDDTAGGQSWMSGLVSIVGPDARFGPDRPGTSGLPNQWNMRQVEGVQPRETADRDTSRIWWSDAGVHQNLTFPVQPDPVSGMHCWLQRVTVEPAHEGDRYGDIAVDTAKSTEQYRAWLAKTRPGPGPGGLRRPLWLARPVKPVASAYLTPPPARSPG